MSLKRHAIKESIENIENNSIGKIKILNIDKKLKQKKM
jgi:hypothetical protein